MGDWRMRAGRITEKKGGVSALTLFLLLFALGFGMIGFVLFRFGSLQEKRGSVITEGVITGYERTHSSRHEYTPVVEFQAGDRTITGTTHAMSNTRRFKEGTHVTVGYNPDDPEEFYIREYDLKIVYQLGTVFMVISAGIILAILVFRILGSSDMEEEKKERIKGKLIIAGFVLIIFIVFAAIGGPGAAVCIFAVMGLFGLLTLRGGKKKK